MKKYFSISIFLLIFVALPTLANHTWGSYHWARSANPLQLNVGDNVNSVWDSHLDIAIADWNQSSVLQLTKVAGNTSPRRCRPTEGMMEVCNDTYGNTGWLGIAQIWASGDHITQGVAKMNDSYFNSPPYNTGPWRQLVMCQEIGHVFGLGHQDENFDDPPMGTCMDYTSDPVPNQHPDAHDYQLLEQIYSHLDGGSGGGGGNCNPKSPKCNAGNGVSDTNNPNEWGQIVRHNARSSVYLRDFGNGRHMITFVFWANEHDHHGHSH